ncbi:unnamed protein product, partial [Symbiodinium pilosum]
MSDSTTLSLRRGSTKFARPYVNADTDGLSKWCPMIIRSCKDNEPCLHAQLKMVAFKEWVEGNDAASSEAFAMASKSLRTNVPSPDDIFLGSHLPVFSENAGSTNPLHFNLPRTRSTTSNHGLAQPLVDK